MSVGSNNVHPIIYNNHEGDTEVHSGMTYRQWLIGQALNGLCANGQVSGGIGKYAIEVADQTIELLDKEGS